MKKSIVAEQILNLNVPDFERAGMKRKAGYKFSFKMKDGKLRNVIVDHPLASSLATVLLEDEAIKKITENNEFVLTLSPKYELTIRHIPQMEVVESE